MTTPFPSWLTGIIEKRPETVLLLHALVLAGLQKGRITSEDAHHIEVSHPNCRGSAMKLLTRVGFSKQPVPVKGTTQQSHGHWLHVWSLVDRGQARRLIEQLQANIMALKSKEPFLPGM